MALSRPADFWELRVHKPSTKEGITGLCVGYECGEWRTEEFVDYILEWLPEFALNSRERESLSHDNAVAALRKAAKLVYRSKKFENRGEFGELFLHAAIRSIFDSTPAISKIYYKTSHNETVKGFDCVHVVGPLSNLELWIGEVKFYSELTRAVRDVIKELALHTSVDFLKDEFSLIGNKVDCNDSFAKDLMQMLSSKTSLDQVFKRVCIPIMLTYNSEVVDGNTIVDQNYDADFANEIEKHYQYFKLKFNINIRFHLFLFPLKSKKVLVSSLDKKLKAWQAI